MAEQLGAKVVINGAKEDTVGRCQQFSGDMGADVVLKRPGRPSPLSRLLTRDARRKNHDRRYGSR